MNPMSLNPMNLLVTVPDLYLTCTCMIHTCMPTHLVGGALAKVVRHRVEFVHVRRVRQQQRDLGIHLSLLNRVDGPPLHLHPLYRA